ncbi:MAG: regulatory protein RecX, partial [Chloroflexota bacterium]|nr:regulatory protein RecX [Chloroflexota bacterium]
MKIIKIPKASTDSSPSLTKKLAEAFDSDEETEGAHTIARRFLSYRPRSELELRKRLLKAFSSEVASKSIAQMYREGLLDDSRFAQMWVDSRQQSRPKSKKTIKQELLSKGISEHTAEQAVSEIHD